MNTTAFIHIRKWKEAKGYLKECENLRGDRCYPDLDNFGGCTIAYNTHRIGDSVVLQYAAAECCDTDRFSKKTGREIAETRLRSDELYGTIELPADVSDDIQKMLVTDYLAGKRLKILTDSVNGGWASAYEFEDFWQPINPGYVWEDSEEATESEEQYYARLMDNKGIEVE